MVSAVARMVEVDSHVSLSVIEVDGADPPFLLVHGLASNARLWDGVGGELGRRGLASLAVDLRGHGRSTKVDDGYDFATVSEDLAQVVTMLASGPVIAVGQSWGGNVVVELANRHPDLVAGLVLVDGGFIRLADRFPDKANALRELAPPRFDGLSWAGLEQRTAGRLRGWPSSAVSAALANFEVGEDGSVTSRLTRERHMKILEELWHHDPDAVMKHIDLPTLLLAAQNGIPDKRQRVETFARSMPRGRVVWMEGDHDLHAQRPLAVAELLVDFSTEIAGSGS